MYTITDWLKKIWEAITALSGSMGTAHQSDWNENDTTAASFIKNKPTIPAVPQSDWNEADDTAASYIKNKPTIPSIPTVGTIVEGAVSEGHFTPGNDAPEFAAVLALIAETPSVVYLSYSNTFDMVVSASSSLIKTAAGVEWGAPAAAE